MTDCIFCKIIKGDIPSKKVYEDEHTLAFDDINPMAPIHVVIVPKVHVATLMDMGPDKRDLMTHLFSAVQKVATIKGINSSGFRTVINTNDEGGQIIYHLHVHVLGGHKLNEQMG